MNKLTEEEVSNLDQGNEIDSDEIVKYADHSCLILSLENPFRKIIIAIVAHRYFKNFMLLVILLNSIIFALPDYSQVNPDGDLILQGSLRNTVVDAADPIFVGLFTFECVMKIISFGFYDRKGAYINDPWNILDFVIVVIGYFLRNIFSSNLPIITFF